MKNPKEKIDILPKTNADDFEYEGGSNDNSKKKKVKFDKKKSSGPTEFNTENSDDIGNEGSV